MPEFSLTPSDLPDAFTKAYLETMEWADCSEDMLGSSWEGFSAELIREAQRDCADFQTINAEVLSRAYETGYMEEQAGVDFWLTRNGHGTGFWDRGLGDRGDYLAGAADAYGGIGLYVGDDGLIYAA